MTLIEDDIIQHYPLHYLVWKNDSAQLKSYLSLHSKDVDLEQKDPRQRTPLMLATALDHKECVRILLQHDALVNATDFSGFNVLHEAVTTADPKLIRDVCLKKELQRLAIRMDGLPNLLTKICDTGDFYIEMKWEFTSCVPLISQICPSDTYKIYKRGSKVRVDSTLIGVDNTTNWQRGNRSLIFIGSENCVYMEVDHNKRRVYRRNMEIIRSDEINDFIEITEEQIADRLTMPIKTRFIDTEKVNFERAKSGIIGFRTDRVKQFNGYECKVYWAQNVEFVTKTRIEHLTREDKQRYKKMKDSSALASLGSFVGIHEQNIPNPFENDQSFQTSTEWRRNPYRLSLVDYFNLTVDDPRDIGSPRELNIKKQYYKANIWMSEDFPLSLKEQILPIVDMMATYSSHFAKLREFITCKLPTGFPVKIEIPLFHLLNARITFGNVFAYNQPVDGVHLSFPSDTSKNINDSSTMTPNLRECKCTIDDRCFDIPEDYEVIGNDSDQSDFNHNENHHLGGSGESDESDDEFLKAIVNEYSLFSKKTSDTITTIKDKNSQESSNSTMEPKLSIMEALSYDSKKDLEWAIQRSLEEYKQQEAKQALAQQAQQPIHHTHSNGTVVKSLKKSKLSSNPKLIIVQPKISMMDQHQQQLPAEISDVHQENVEESFLTTSLSSSSSSSYVSYNNENDGGVPTTTIMNQNDEHKKHNEVIDEDERLIRLAMEQSKRDHDELIRRQEKEEQEIFDRVLKLSLIEK